VIAVISALFGFGAGMGHFGTPFIIMLLAIIPALLAGLAIGIKRLHDRNKSGWWLLLFWVVPGLLQGGGMGMGQESAGLIATLAGAAISIWGFVEIGCLRGTTGPNGYGPDPLPAES
jgi:uncharacterized membrane protein YhaH (DUF805 family)